MPERQENVRGTFIANGKTRGLSENGPMIKFFRKIRHRMLKESPPDQSIRAGKFSPPERHSRAGKYLLYAIGEIILVVIGILIAVQINDWNEERKLSIANRIHLDKMVAEMDENIARMHILTQDEDAIVQNFPPLDEAILNCDSLLRLSYSGLREEHLPFILHARFYAGRSVLNLQQDVFEELKSTGRLNTLGSDSLIKQIKGYSKRYLREVRYNDEHNRNIIRAIDKLEYGFDKMRQDYRLDSLNFSIDNYPWFHDPVSLEYQNLQIAFGDLLDSQEKNYFKMMEMSRLSESLKQSLLEHLNSNDR
jgi:hypothetical protein